MNQGMDESWSLLAIAGLVLVTAGGTWLDRQRHSTWLTPFSALAVPFTAVVVLAFLLAAPLGFVRLHHDVVWLWLSALVVFWLVGLVMLWPLQDRLRQQVQSTAAIGQDSDAYWPAIGLAWLALTIMAFGLQMALFNSGGWAGLGSAEFRSIFGRGMYGHASVASLVLLIYFLGSRRLREPLTLITVGGIVVAALLYGVKSWLILPVLAGIYYRVNTGRLRITPALVLLVAAAGFAMFFAVYLVRFAANGTRSLWDPVTYTDLLRHFATYLFAGVLGFSEFLRFGRQTVYLNDELAIFAPFVNIYRFLFQRGAPMVVIINPNYLVISAEYQKHSNVPTLVGTLWLYWGTTGMLVYMAGLSVVMHVSFALGQWLRNCWLLVLWSFWAALLSISWFEMYFWHLDAIEIPVLALTMMMVTALWTRMVSLRRERVQV